MRVMNWKHPSPKRILFACGAALVASFGIWFLAVFVATWRIQVLAKRFNLVVVREFDGRLKLGNWIGQESHFGCPTVVALSTNRLDVLRSCRRTYPAIRKLVVTELGDEAIPEIESLHSLTDVWLCEFDFSEALLSAMKRRHWSGMILNSPRTVSPMAIDSFDSVSVDELCILGAQAQDDWIDRTRLPADVEHLGLVVERLPERLSEDLAKMIRLKTLSIVIRDGSQVDGELLLSCPSPSLQQVYLVGQEFAVEPIDLLKFADRGIALTINGSVQNTR